ncbi:MAG: hypothetical protein H6831_06535 [Planctomycetes bacterium]|nr:hypothetical protein [Planctomycetota bacterium]MCB9904046.1 hypothetical protein [Planctomycetota bacterium]
MQSTPRPFRLRRLLASAVVLTGIGTAATALGTSGMLPLGTTIQDFFMNGTQPNELNVEIYDSSSCSACHGFYDPTMEPYEPWTASLMGQAGRDPVFYACLDVANQDVTDSGDLCLRCHAPGAWLAGRSTPTDGSALSELTNDFDGVTCHFCHRMVDPVADPLNNPLDDTAILAGLTTPSPTNPHTGQFVIDPDDNRRGPFDLGPGFFFHNWRQSPFHRESLMCASCHDVSNPAFDRQLDGTYVLNATNTPHPTQQKEDAFPVERTFSEWNNSQYAVRDFETNGRFGGNETAVSSCQDCHMPKTSGVAAGFGNPQFRDDLPQHFFNGGNTWVLKAVRSLYSDGETNLSAQSVDDSIARAKNMLRNAATLESWQDGSELMVRVTNETGHKLPTGYPEGRRMWLNVRFYGAGDVLVAEHGHYDDATADLTTGDTVVFEAQLGLDDYMAAQTGLQAGESFHFVLNNTYLKDNRIPPRGYEIAAFEAAGAGAVDIAYDQSQFWHDATFQIPGNAARAEVRLLYQTTSKEYIEFLQQHNDPTTNRGQIAYDQWVLHGKSAPVVMGRSWTEFNNQKYPEPIEYGLAKELTAGGYPRLYAAGKPRLATNQFRLKIENAKPNRPCAIIWSNAPDNAFQHGGMRLVATPFNRLPVFNLGGFGESTVAIPIDGSMVGTQRAYQAWFRDSGQIGMTNGLLVTFCD